MKNSSYILILAFAAIATFSCALSGIVVIFDAAVAKESWGWIVLISFGIVAGFTLAFGFTREFMDEIQRQNDIDKINRENED